MHLPIGPLIRVSSMILEYFGLIEGVNTNVTKLLHQAFNSAKANLEYALNTTGQNRIDYIKQARTEFNQAITVEENENKILALVGLAMCQHLLGDTDNAIITYDKISSVSLTKAEKNKFLVKKNAVIMGINIIRPFLVDGRVFGAPNPLPLDFSLSERIACLEALKKDALGRKTKILQ